MKKAKTCYQGVQVAHLLENLNSTQEMREGRSTGCETDEGVGWGRRGSMGVGEGEGSSPGDSTHSGSRYAVGRLSC